MPQPCQFAALTPSQPQMRNWVVRSQVSSLASCIWRWSIVARSLPRIRGRLRPLPRILICPQIPPHIFYPLFSSQTLDPITSFPPLEDLTEIANSEMAMAPMGLSSIVWHPSSPTSTRPLELSLGRDEICRPSIVAPARQSPLPEAHF